MQQQGHYSKFQLETHTTPFPPRHSVSMCVCERTVISTAEQTNNTTHSPKIIFPPLRANVFPHRRRHGIYFFYYLTNEPSAGDSVFFPLLPYFFPFFLLPFMPKLGGSIIMKRNEGRGESIYHFPQQNEEDGGEKSTPYIVSPPHHIVFYVAKKGCAKKNPDFKA